MNRRRGTKAPCPGCGKTDSTRHADSVCGECARAIKNWSEHVAKVNADKTLATVKLKGAWHWYPGFYFGGPQAQIEGFSETREELHKLFCELGELACEEKFDWKDQPCSGDEDAPKIAYLFERPDVRYPKKKTEHYARPAEYPASEGSSCFQTVYGKLDSRLLDVIRLLWDHTARFAELAYLGGLQDGKNLLLQMASGQLSSDDLQKKDLALARDVQNAAFLHKKLKRHAS
jgi:hypothetical protein